ncbi:MAG: hypothetical protein K0Q92_2891 [Steroidobacteraceae bacterium]|nr:hypothetical protein [Steroidobacteraceae bacterium]
MILATSTALADPWLSPGDEALRHDIQLLSDAGIIRGPVTTWPLSWPDLARDVLNRPMDGGLGEAVLSALIRVQRQARRSSALGYSGIGLKASGAHEPVELRGFADMPREEGEVAARASWLTNHFAVNLQGAVVADPDNGKKVRADGSYVGLNVGNFMVSAGYMERWWGPGWDGSLILSTNSRPIPSLTIERNYTDPFRTPLLSWLGPWRASIAVGQAEGSDVAVADVRFLAARVNFRPRPWLEVGLTRTAQWCGEGRICDFETFANLLIGRDNRDESLPFGEEPGNQMAGYDLRLRSPYARLPVAVYTQWIGEDEAGGLPSKFLGQAGVETWGAWGRASWRVHAEFTDTTCTFTREQPDFDCAYRNAHFPQGYTHRGRVIGHSMDNDSRAYSLGALFMRDNGDSLSLLFRHVELNRDGGQHSISTLPREVDNVELRLSGARRFGKIGLGLGYGDPRRDSADDSGMHAFVTWQQGF